MDLSELAVNERIKFLRKLKNYNQEQMGEFFEIKTSTYSQKERKGHFTAEDVKIVCEVFHVDPNLIIFGKLPIEQEFTDLEKKLEAEIEEKYRQKYEKYENIALKDYKMFQLINMLNREERNKVHEFAYGLYKIKKNGKDPA